MIVLLGWALILPTDQLEIVYGRFDFLALWA